VTIETPSMAAIKAAGAITKGISLVNQMSVSIFFLLAMMNVMARTFLKIYIQTDNSTRPSNMAQPTDLDPVYDRIYKINYLV